VTVERKDLTRKITLPGSLVAFNEATLYGKVAGYLKAISVDKGDRVRRGETLALLEVPEMVKEIDQAQAAYQEALANLNQAKAEAELQGVTYKRYSEVHTKDPEAIANQELDQYRTKYEVAEANVKLAEARVATAAANRDRLIALHQYANITAPFSGVITARFVDPGALIQAATSSTQGQAIVTVRPRHHTCLRQRAGGQCSSNSHWNSGFDYDDSLSRQSLHGFGDTFRRGIGSLDPHHEDRNRRPQSGPPPSAWYVRGCDACHRNRSECVGCS
jgi:biotin carboxyl carrier protein